MFTILHISDLHRAAAEPFGNDEILSSLLADSGRHSSESPPIAKPDAIIVSGDLVQGLPLKSPDYPNGIVKQYEAAFDLLVRLTETFLAGNRSNLVVIPGNHDVDFNQSRFVMAEVRLKNVDIKGVLFGGHDNPHRWCWNDGKVYKIVDPTGYEDRFKYYSDLFNRFYDGVALAYPVDPTGYSNLFELDDSRIIVAALNSCHGNDCFNQIGEIPPGEIAKCHLAISRSGKRYRLKVAVWHHDVAGPPRRFDYMDSETVKLLIDKGFRLGLHGHQHKASAAPEFVYTAPNIYGGCRRRIALCRDRGYPPRRESTVQRHRDRAVLHEGKGPCPGGEGRKYLLSRQVHRARRQVFRGCRVDARRGRASRRR